jgi:hypothetical protein
LIGQEVDAVDRLGDAVDFMCDLETAFSNEQLEKIIYSQLDFHSSV